MLKDISHFTEKSQSNSDNLIPVIKSEEEIAKIRESAGIVRDLLLQLHKVVKPGVNERDIATFCENYIILRNATPFLKTENIFPYAVNISRNNVAFHGIPQNQQLVEGDIVTVDVVLEKDGWFGDGAWTYSVGKCSAEADNLINFSRDIVTKCISSIERSGDLSSIVSVIDDECRQRHFRVLDEGAGHGIGRELHEDPEILFGSEARSIPLRRGMVFTIEPVFTNCTKSLSFALDGTAYVPEGFLTSQFEHMVAVVDGGLEILTDRKALFK